MTESKRRWTARLAQARPVLADGAMGTELQRQGLPPGTPSDGFTLTRPEAVLEVHRAYRAAGAELLLTNTFNCWRGLEPAGGGAARLIEAAVTLAREAGGPEAFVAASIGPPLNEAAGFVRAGAMELARAFARAGADLIWLESQLSIEEVLEAVPAMGAACDLPILVSFSFHGPGSTTHRGETAAEVAAAMLELPIDALGGNCGTHPRDLAPVLEVMHRVAPRLPLIARPSAGLPERGVDGLRYPVAPETFAAFLPDWIAAGARILGGCCGAGPAHLCALAGAVNASDRG